MARPKNVIPTYRLHSPSGMARCWVNNRWVTLGRYNSAESRAEYARLVAELAVTPIPTHSCLTGPGDATLNEVMLTFLKHAETHYRRPDGTPTNEVAQYRQTFRLVRELYGHTLARDFGPLALSALREKMIEAGWSRKLINQRIDRIRRVFGWAVARQLVDAGVWQALAAVRGLQAGRTAARETEPVGPVDEGYVRATLPFLTPAVRVMAQVQLLTGMRPGEVCQLRPCDLEREGPVWRFRPVQYKTRHLGRPRVIAVGSRAQQLLAESTPSDPAEFYFSPRRTVAELHALRAQGRKTPRYPSHAARNAAKRVPSPKRQASAYYTVTSYGRAIRRAVERANRRREQLAGVGNFDRIPHWHPNQLRHTLATRVRKEYGLEVAQVVLGHANAHVTEIYAEIDLAKADRVAADIG